MPNNPLDEMFALAGWYGLLAAFALPIALLLGVRRSTGVRRLPRLATSETLAFTLLALMLPLLVLELFQAARIFEHANLPNPMLQLALARLVGAAAWLVLFLWWLARRGNHSQRESLLPRWRQDLASGALAFIVITPITLAIYWLALALLHLWGGTPEEHPLIGLDLNLLPARLLFVGTACVAAPVLEEGVFRGFLLSWARMRRYRPWLIFAAAAGLLVLTRGLDHTGMIFFLIDAAVLMLAAAFGREVWKKWPHRTGSAIVSTAVLFAVLHAAVWPTPYPLAVLGMGLGVLAVRTGSFWPCVVVHALFNLVSVLYRLSSHG